MPNIPTTIADANKDQLYNSLNQSPRDRVVHNFNRIGLQAKQVTEYLR